MADELICRCRKRLRSGFELEADLRIPLAEAPVTVLFGPSGSGKTTLLRLLAGLETADCGEIRFRGETWYDSGHGAWRPPQQRRASFLFQDYALFPHLTVARNVEYAAPRGKARELLDAFGLADLAARSPRAISGGQQQRVALARALAAGPALLLLDEPLSALDHATRLRLRHELRRELVSGGVPSIVVTHDRLEAVGLGDWMAVMVDGRIRQAGPVQEVFRHPADAQVAESVGVENVLPVEVAARDGGLLTLRVGAARIECVAGGEDFAAPAVPLPAWACIRAEDVTLTRDAGQASSARNRLAGRVRAVTLEGPLARVELDCGFPLVAAITAQSAADMRLKSGDVVCAVMKATAVHLIPA
ncbi:MAG: ABC transporter ATP-binding protein [Bryobacteraceae bacterium]|jgi:molybdate transport system ATP-binding protein